MRAGASGPSHDRVVKMVLPALLKSKRCLNLKIIRLFGFEAHDEGVDEAFRGCGNFPNRSVDVPGQI